MKRIVTFVLVTLCLSLQVSAQVKIGVDAGMNLTHFKSHYSREAQKVGGMGAGFQIGVTVDYEFKRHWMLMSGVSFMQTQSNMELSDGMFPHFPDTKIKLNHIVIPLKVGYNIQISKKLSLIPSVGIYGSYNFSAGKCPLDLKPSSDGKGNIERAKWNPMKGYSYEVPIINLPGYYSNIELGALRHWTYGGVAGLKAVVNGHYTVSFQYYESIKEIQSQCDLRDYGYQLSVGYTF
ncbi:MAG: PorT family protein [Bacteroides oleiciplenus]|nr:PorT family protein [Bacteroides oleiciplenus]